MVAFVGFGGFFHFVSAAPGDWGWGRMVDNNWRQNPENVFRNNNNNSWGNMMPERRGGMFEGRTEQGIFFGRDGNGPFGREENLRGENRFFQRDIVSSWKRDSFRRDFGCTWCRR